MYYLESRSRGISYMKYVNGRLTGVVTLRRNCLLQQVNQGKINGGMEVTGRRGRRSSKLLDDFKKRRGYSHLKEENLGRTVWRAGFGRGFGPVVRQTVKWMNDESVVSGKKRLYFVYSKWQKLINIEK
jgi:hypothetical protein